MYFLKMQIIYLFSLHISFFLSITIHKVSSFWNAHMANSTKGKMNKYVKHYAVGFWQIKHMCMDAMDYIQALVNVNFILTVQD